jgi:uncharacterized membrane protein
MFILAILSAYFTMKILNSNTVSNKTLIIIALITIIGIYYFVMKLMFWDSLSLGMAPLIIGAFLMFSILLFFIGILGEYIGQIYTQLLNRPLVFEKERINFEE